MCLALLALHAHPRYAVVIAANRDEFHARPGEAAGWWEDGWLAGRDLGAGGTWLGVTRAGRWALLTNVREPARNVVVRGQPLVAGDALDECAERGGLFGADPPLVDSDDFRLEFG